MSFLEQNLWRAADRLYRQYRENTDMETSRACLVTHLRLMADEIEDRSRLPDGTRDEEGLIE